MVLVLGLRSEREVRGSKIRDGEGQSWAGGMVWRNLGREVFRKADARCAASTAAPAAERERWGKRGERQRQRALQYKTETAQEVCYQKQHDCVTLISPGLCFCFS